MLIITWVLLVTSIIFLIGQMASVYIVESIQLPARIIYYAYLAAYVFVGLLIFTAKDLFVEDVVMLVWKITSCLVFINFTIIYFVKYRAPNVRAEVDYLIVLCLCLGFSTIPFVLKMTVQKSHQLRLINLGITYPTTSMTFLIPMVIVTVCICFVFYFFISYSKKAEYEKLTSLIIRMTNSEFDFNRRRESNRQSQELESSRTREFEDKLYRNLNEEIQHHFKKFEDMFHRQLYLFDDFQKFKGKHTFEEPSQIGSNEFVEISNSLDLIKSSIKNLNVGAKIGNGGIYSNYNNQIFIRELFHYLITPLSQIEAKTIILYRDPSIFEDIPRIQKMASTIKTSVEICKTVLSAYRELAFVVSSSDWSPESLNQSVIAAGNLYKESMEKEVEICSNLLDDFAPYSNNYLLAALLPLLENAIKASPTNKTVKIGFELGNSTIDIFIENEALNMPTVEQLKTPGFSSKKAHKGTGLLIARHLIEDHNRGALKFESVSDTLKAIISIPITLGHESKS